MRFAPGIPDPLGEFHRIWSIQVASKYTPMEDMWVRQTMESRGDRARIAHLAATWPGPKRTTDSIRRRYRKLLQQDRIAAAQMVPMVLVPVPHADNVASPAVVPDADAPSVVASGKKQEVKSASSFPSQ